MKIAIVGTGISGLTAAYYLSKKHQVTVFERAGKIGGHTATIDVEHNGEQHAVDTGFIVYNDWTYPNFIRLLDELQVDTRPTRMSFSVTCESSGLEYAGSDLNGLFADRSNIVNIRYWKMLQDILRFNREAVQHLDAGKLGDGLTLGEYLQANKYGELFREKYLIPMGAAIWSSGDADMLNFPMLFFVRFFKNHGLLSIKNRPQWHTIVGGSAQYLKPLTERFSNDIITGADIFRVHRSDDGVELSWSTRNESSPQTARYDAMVIATHSDQALDLLSLEGAQPTEQEADILGKIPYVENEVVLHTDESRLPRRRRAWCSWNYRLTADGAEGALPKLTYNMNILQGLQSTTTFCVSLNQTETIDEKQILQTFRYSHPLFTLDGIDAQHRWHEIAGANRTWFCGAYWRNGFHEDGVSSALQVVESIAERFERTSTEPGRAPVELTVADSAT
jgi:predicted NAD/FAD-binding protein